MYGRTRPVVLSDEELAERNQGDEPSAARIWIARAGNGEPPEASVTSRPARAALVSLLALPALLIAAVLIAAVLIALAAR